MNYKKWTCPIYLPPTGGQGGSMARTPGGIITINPQAATPGTGIDPRTLEFLDRWGQAMMGAQPADRWTTEVESLIAKYAEIGHPLDPKVAERLRGWIAERQQHALLLQKASDALHAPGSRAAAIESRALTAEEIDFAVKVLDAIMIGPKHPLRGELILRLKAALSAVTLYRGPDGNWLAKGILANRENWATTLQGDSVFFQPDKFPLAVTQPELATQAEQEDLALLVHELTHIGQQINLVLFYLHYVAEGSWNGYSGISSEIEAWAVQKAVEALVATDPSIFSRPLTPDEAQKLRELFLQWKRHFEINGTPG